MKQITLVTSAPVVNFESPCAGKLFFVWGLYGLGMALLWRLAAGSGVSEVATWVIAGAIGLLLAREV